MSKDAKRAAELLKLWSKAEARVGGMVPDGTYEAEIVKVEVSIKNEAIKVHWELKITDGQYDGKPVHRWDTIKTEENLGYFKGALKTLDIDAPEELADLDELRDLLQAAVGLAVEIRVVTKNEFTNTYYQQLLDATEADDDESEKDETEEETEKTEEEDSEDEDEDEAEAVEDDDEEEEEEEEKPAKKAKKAKK